MKKLILAVTIAASFSANATVTKQEWCEINGKFATNVQMMHQSGAPLSSVFDTVNKSDLSEDHKDGLAAMAIMAYERPRWHTDSSKHREVEDFHNLVFLSCIKGKLWSY